MPIVGVDAVIFKHGDYPACDAIKEYDGIFNDAKVSTPVLFQAVCAWQLLSCCRSGIPAVHAKTCACMMYTRMRKNSRWRSLWTPYWRYLCREWRYWESKIAQIYKNYFLRFGKSRSIIVGMTHKVIAAPHRGGLHKLRYINNNLSDQHSTLNTQHSTLKKLVKY